MIDFHTHILPGLDDGADFLADSLVMARMAWAEGTRAMVLTPHCHVGKYHNGRERIITQTSVLRQHFWEEGIPVVLFPAAEVYLHADLPGQVVDGDILTINDMGKHLLVELPFGRVPPYTEEVLCTLLHLGITPVLAHPERCDPLVANLHFLEQLVSQGILIQMNAGSITGDYGPVTAQRAELLVRRGWVHLLGSDAHSINQRPPGLSRAIRQIAGMVGGTAAHVIGCANPLAVLEGGNPSGFNQTLAPVT